MATTYKPIELVLRPHKGWQAIDVGEIWATRELFNFLVWRDVKVRYKQTLLGGLWAVLQPLLAMLIFTVFFNRLAGIGTDGPPYPLFAYTGLVLWTFFSNSISMASNSLVGNQVLVSKVYFPRVFIPLASIGALLLDLLVSMLLLIVLMFWYHWHVTAALIWFPLYVIGTILSASGLGLILSGLNVRFRDVKYAVPFLIQMGLFVSPVIYPLRYVPARFRLLMGINPMAGMITGFRASVIGGAMDWPLVGVSFGTCAVLFVGGLYLFRRMERRFADII